MERIGLRLIGDAPTGEPLAVDANESTGMVAAAYGDGDGLLVETYHDAVGLVTWYRADSWAQVAEWLGVS